MVLCVWLVEVDTIWKKQQMKAASLKLGTFQMGIGPVLVLNTLKQYRREVCVIGSDPDDILKLPAGTDSDGSNIPQQMNWNISGHWVQNEGVG